MTISKSLLVSVFGLAIVFVVLVALSLVITLLSKILGAFRKKEKTPQGAPGNIPQQAAAETQDAGIAAGELKLIDVDEKTAAIIMAIVSHESGIPLSELQFKSIKALD